MKNTTTTAAPKNAPGLAPPLWERPELRRVAGDTLRPGALTLTERAAAIAGLQPGWTVLDVGAGLGATTAHLRRRHGALAVGVEPSDAQLARRVSPQVPLMRARAEALPIADSSQRLVLCECVLSLVPHPEDAVAELARALAPGGWLAVSDLYLNEYPSRGHAWCDCGPDETCAAQGGGTSHGASANAECAACPSCAHGALHAPDIERLVLDAGLEIVQFEDHTRLLKELAARLILAGVSPCRETTRHGYFLLMARKPEAPHA